MTETAYTVHVTDKLKIAGALSAAGFAIKSADIVRHNDIDTCVVEMEPMAHGIKANRLVEIAENKTPNPAQEICERYGITAEDYAYLVFDAALAGISNRSAILWGARNRAPLIAKDIRDGRLLIYRAGTPKEELKKLIKQ
jgi:hypothetical protein